MPSGASGGIAARRVGAFERGSRSLAGGPSIQPGFGNRRVAAHDPQAQLDHIGILRIDFEAGAQAVQLAVRNQGRV